MYLFAAISPAARLLAFLLPCSLFLTPAFAQRRPVTASTETPSHISRPTVAERAPAGPAPSSVETSAPVIVSTPAPEANITVQPEFPGGDAALIQFLGQNLHYPADAWKERVQGRVDISFWIDEQGRPYGFGLLQSVYPSLDAEALRALKLMPSWTPGQRNNKNVPMMVHVPVSFRLPALTK